MSFLADLAFIFRSRTRHCAKLRSSYPLFRKHRMLKSLSSLRVFAFFFISTRTPSRIVILSISAWTNLYVSRYWWQWWWYLLLEKSKLLFGSTLLIILPGGSLRLLFSRHVAIVARSRSMFRWSKGLERSCFPGLFRHFKLLERYEFANESLTKVQKKCGISFEF